jgi:hypothetical protein
MPQPRLTFAHQDGALGFRVADASFTVSKGLLSLSLSCVANRRHDFMDEPRFAAHNLPLRGRPEANQVFEIREEFEPARLDAPRAHVYVGEHFQPRDTYLEVVGVAAGELAVRGAFVINDPLYYDKRAKDTRAKFFAVFTRARKENLWAPF